MALRGRGNLSLPNGLERECFSDLLIAVELGSLVYLVFRLSLRLGTLLQEFGEVFLNMNL